MLALNADFVGRLMAQCRKVRAFVHTSTAAVYPWSPAGTVWKESDLIGPGSEDSYGLSKFAGEAIVTFASQYWNVPSCILRLAYPYNEEGGLIRVLIEWVADGRPIPVNRRQQRGYNPIHLSDYCRYSMLSVDHCSVPARLINACGGEAIPQLELLDRIGTALGKSPQLGEAEASRIGYLEPTWVLDPTLLTDLMGKHRVTLDEGIKRAVNAFRGRR